MVCKGMLRYSVTLPIELVENQWFMHREIVACKLIDCPKSRGKHIITERCWRYNNK